MRARLAASVVVAALVLGATAGCTFITPQVTVDHYDPSDGIGADVAGIQVRNALMLTSDGETASLLINLANSGKYGTTVNLQYNNASGEKVNQAVYVNSKSVKSFGGENDAKILMTGIDTSAGALFPVFVQPEGETGKLLAVPVLDGSASEYSALLP